MRHHTPLLFVLSCACGSDTPAIRNLVPEMAVSPEALDFGEIVVGEAPSTLEVFVTNGGPVDLEVGLAIAGEDAFAFAGDPELVVEPDGAIAIPVSFAPTELRPYAAELVLTTNDPDDEGIFRVPLAGIGRVPYAPDIEILGEDSAPTSILDFGEVASSADRLFQIANRGDADLHLGSVIQTGAGTFSMATDDPSGATVSPGQALTVLVHYDASLTDGDSGEIAVASDDPDEPEVTLALEANGGGSFEYPVAVIDCPRTLDLEGAIPVALDGSESHDPSGAPLVGYAWQLIRLPEGVAPGRAMAPSDQPSATLLVDAVGEWEVSLTVTSETGFRSVPAKCLLDVASIDDLHVELSWSGPTSDLDLHLALDEAELFSVPGDTSWCNPSPDWGAAGDPVDDGRLDLDDDRGYGPEHAGVNRPIDGAYLVRVHHFDDGDDGDVTAHVAVYADSGLLWSGSKVLERNEVWDVGQVNWPEKSFGAFSTEPWDAEGVRECR